MLNPAKFINTLRPLKTILAINQEPHKLALSISDGYLSFATPLIETTLTLELLNQHAVGGVLHLSKNGVADSFFQQSYVFADTKNQ